MTHRGAMSKHPLYGIWTGMMQRCNNPRNFSYAKYGGRGIKVCRRWKDDFWAFAQDMGEQPRGMSLDRIDPDGDYDVGNCRWATALQQNRNRRKRDEDDWMAFDVALYLGVSRDWVLDKAAAGIIPFHRAHPRGRFHFKADEIIAWYEQVSRSGVSI